MPKSQVSLLVYDQVQAALSVTPSPVPQGLQGVGRSGLGHFTA